jgi:hypothetical protein
MDFIRIEDSRFKIEDSRLKMDCMNQIVKEPELSEPIQMQVTD